MTEYNKGDRVKFLGVNASAQERQDAQITGIEGAWVNLPAGALGTVTEALPYEPDKDSSQRLFVTFDDVAMPFDAVAELLGMPHGWPILASELEPVNEEAAA